MIVQNVPEKLNKKTNSRYVDETLDSIWHLFIFCNSITDADPKD